MIKKLIDIRTHLIEIARKDYDNITYYYDIINKFELKYDMINETDRRKFSNDLAKILKYEIDNGRPCLTILIVSRKFQDGFNIQIPSKGFYYYVEKYKKNKNCRRMD